jgi:hypothetical protein
MTDRRRWLAVGLVIASAALLVLGIAAAIDTPGRRVSDVASTLGFVVPVAAFAIVGGLISLRRPGHLIGWLLATIGLLFGLVVACSSGSRWVLETRALPQAAGEWISVGSNMWVVALGLIGTQLPLRLPNGKLPSRRWRWYSRVSLALIGVSLVGMTAQPGRVEGVPGTAGPLDATWAAPLASVFLLVILSFIGGLAALVVRYRRADVGDKVQLRWIAFGGVVFLAIYLVTAPLQSILGLSEDGAEATAIITVTQAAFAALPISIGYAVLRHRLYDIDAVISRTLVYGALTTTLATTYLGSVLLLQLLLNGLVGDSGLAVAASTLAVAALFRPARSRIQALVDRRFYRHKYDAQRTIEAFAARMRDEVALDALSAELRAVVADVMQPAHVSLWLHSPQPRVPAAQVGVDRGSRQMVSVTARTRPPSLSP